MPRRSKITQLPKALKDWVEQTLAANNYSGYKAMVGAMRVLGEKLGVDPKDLPGKSALHRYGSALEAKLQSMKDATHAAVLLNKESPDDAGMLGAMTMTMAQTSLFNVMVALRELGALGPDADPAKRVALIARVAKASTELSRAGVSQKKWQLDLSGKATAAADAAAKIGRKGGLSKAGVEEIRREILGIAQT